MKEAIMSQSAEQSANDDVPPVRPSGEKRKFSADSFRSLASRLNEKKAQIAPKPVLVTETVLPVESIQEDLTAHDTTVEAKIAPVEVPTEETPIEEISVAASVRETGLAENHPHFDIAAPNAQIALETIPHLPENLPKAFEPVCVEPEIQTTEPDRQISQPDAPEYAVPAQGAEQVELVEASEPAVLGEQRRLVEEFKLEDDAEILATADVQPETLEHATPTEVAEQVVLVEEAELTVSAEQSLPVEEFKLEDDAETLAASEVPPETQEQPAQQQSPYMPVSDVVDVVAPAIRLVPDARSGETARALLDLMSSTAGGSQPQERTLAADTLLHLVPRMTVKDLVSLSRRVCLMDDVPQLLVKALIAHPESAVAKPLLEDGNIISEQDLLNLVKIASADRLVMITKGRHLSAAVCEVLISHRQASVDLELVRNAGARLSHECFVDLCETAKSISSLQAPLATREDTPPPIAFELFWVLPVELRRYVLSRFLTDSAALEKILKLIRSVGDENTVKRNSPSVQKVAELMNLIADGATDQASSMMADMAGINQNNARRIIADSGGEPLVIALKTIGLPRTKLGAEIQKCANSPKAMLRTDRDLDELQIVFDSLSFNKARTLLTYWDWAVEKTGPYAHSSQ